METKSTAATPAVAAQYIPRKQLAIELGERMRGRPFVERTLIQWERRGEGPPATRVGRAVTYFAPSVEQWLREREGLKK